MATRLATSATARWSRHTLGKESVGSYYRHFAFVWDIRLLPLFVMVGFLPFVVEFDDFLGGLCLHLNGNKQRDEHDL